MNRRDPKGHRTYTKGPRPSQATKRRHEHVTIARHNLPPTVKRRGFLEAGLLAGASAALPAWIPSILAGASPKRPGLPLLRDVSGRVRGGSSLAMALASERPRLTQPHSAPEPPPAPRHRLADTFVDLSRHFVFEYYPWYGTAPWRHWNQWDRDPPEDLATHYYPRLGPYDSLSTSVLEQHATWIAGSGVGSINLSWWGRDSFEDRATHRVMDVMKAHGLKVAFHLEPYADDRGQRLRDDVLYIVREYGEKRRFDALLLLENADGRTGPVFKGFRCIVPESVSCDGRTYPVRDHTPDGTWKGQIESLKASLRHEFDHVTVLADLPDFDRLPRTGFDGVAVYDNFVPPWAYAPMADAATERNLLFSFNVNPGFDAILPRKGEPEPCYEPPPFEPETEPPLDFSRAADRERAAQVAEARIEDSLRRSLAVQEAPNLGNARRGFFLVYITSFNEWHEGHAFEPMRDGAELAPAERAHGYRNPARGTYRMDALSRLLAPVLSPSDPRCHRRRTSPEPAG